jgi:CHAT domain-containing protein
MTVHEELRRGRAGRSDRAPGPVLVAFGDPALEMRADGSAGQRSISGLHQVYAPLPAAREEVEAVGALFGDRARVWLGAAATEERAHQIGQSPRYVHFATHGFVNERFPLDSGLLLACPRDPDMDAENGVLQAWEVFERVRLNADLVTLSACDTALGKQVVGEGIVGLTRAFQYAGAQSVLASLWSVADESTSLLMRAFYANLQGGMSKDEALRQAQLVLLGGRARVGTETVQDQSRLQHPYYWAAFELFGDWR